MVCSSKFDPTEIWPARKNDCCDEAHRLGDKDIFMHREGPPVGGLFDLGRFGVGTSAAYGVELTPEKGPQSLTGGAAVPMVVLSEGEFSKSNMSSSVSAN